MSNILDAIITRKRQEVAERKALVSVAALESRPACQRAPVSLKERLLLPDASGIIAEFKRRSPSQGDIHAGASAPEVAAGYVEAGASGLSILTDETFFGGSLQDLADVRAAVAAPLLRKDFIIDEYQLLEARANGADVVLLIAACLGKAELHALAQAAKALQLEILVEVHNRSEIDKVSPLADLVGVNNRNLKDFSMSLAASLELFPDLPSEMVKISESGIEDPDAILSLRHVGYRGFLIGTYFMRAERPQDRCREFIEAVARREALYKGAIAGL